MPTHGNCCLGTGVRTCSGEFSGWIVATGSMAGGRRAAGWSNLGHPGASKDLWVCGDLSGKRGVGRNRMGKAWCPDPFSQRTLSCLGWRPRSAQQQAVPQTHLPPRGGWTLRARMEQGRSLAAVQHLPRILTPKRGGRQGGIQARCWAVREGMQGPSLAHSGPPCAQLALQPLSRML